MPRAALACPPLSACILDVWLLRSAGRQSSKDSRKSELRTVRVDPDDMAASEQWSDVKEGAASAIVGVAMAVFSERGFHGSTTREIASRSNLSPAGLYVHFRSKESVLLAICMTAHRRTDDLLTKALSGPPSETRLAAAIGELAAWHAENNQMARVAQYELDCLNTESRAVVAALRRRIQGRVQAYLTVLVREGTVTADDVRSVSRGLVSLCVDVCRWYDSSGSLRSRDIRRIYTDLAMRMLDAEHAEDDVV
jgi:AcrR family transcriptional regulator